MKMELSPSKEMWDYYFKANWERGNITDISVCSAIADVMAGYKISYTANEVLKDLGLYDNNGKINKKAKEALCHYLHGLFHGGESGLRIVPPELQGKDKANDKRIESKHSEEIKAIDKAVEETLAKL